MTTARDIMTTGVECAHGRTPQDAARKMRDLDVGALPICGEDNRLKGMITDRDIVVKCVAEGHDPVIKVEESARTRWSPSAPTTRSRRRCAR